MTFPKDVKNAVSNLQILNCRVVIVKTFISISSMMKLYVFVLVDIALRKGIKYKNFCLDILSIICIFRYSPLLTI